MITFRNDGELDLRAALTFGVHAKETKNPFGQFGTGLKYALAVLLRTGHKITVYSGTDVYKVSTGTLAFRNKEFEQVCIDDQAVGFTTHLGSNWEVWQAYRELVCNAMDEPNWSFGRITTAPISSAGKTNIVVEGEELEYVHDHGDRYFIFDANPIYNNLPRGLQIYDLPEQGIFLKGVRIGEMKNQRFSYNFTQAGPSISEDRGIKYSFEVPELIGRALIQSSNLDCLKTLMLMTPDCGDDRFEHDIDYAGTPSEAFVAVSRDINKNKKVMPYRGAWAAMKQLGLHEEDHKKYTPTNMESKMLQRALDFLELVDHPVTFPIEIMDDLGTGKLALAMIAEQKIRLSKQVFNHGTRYLVSTLFEECVHIDTGYGDCTRELQTYLFDRLVGMMERAVGEPI